MKEKWGVGSVIKKRYEKQYYSTVYLALRSYNDQDKGNDTAKYFLLLLLLYRKRPTLQKSFKLSEYIPRNTPQW